MKLVHLFVCVFIFTFLGKATSDLSSEKESLIDHVISNIFMPLAHVPAVGVGIVQSASSPSPDDIFFAKSYGWRDAENFIDADNQTKFLIASITKTFTSTLIVKTLNEKYPELGEWALDVPLKTLLPQSNFTFSDRYRSESMSFRDLMSHRHCLRTENVGLGSGAFANANEYAYRTRYAREECDFRTFASYSNAMYSLLGKLVGELAGSTYEAMLEDLFQSLEMASSSYVKESIDYDSLENMSKGYIRKNGIWEKMNPELYKRITAALSGGGVVSTPTDMAKYMRFHLNYGRVGNQQIVPESVMKWLHTPAVALPFLSPKEYPEDTVNGLYALGTGFSLGLFDGWTFRRHSGDWAPFLSSMTLFPDANIGIFTTCNGPGNLPVNMGHDYLHEEIFKILLGNDQKARIPDLQDIPQISTGLEEQLIQNFTGKAFDDLSQLAGVYGNPIEGDFEIAYNASDSNGELYLKYGKWSTGYLRYVNLTNAFEIEFDTDLLQEFYSAGLVNAQGFLDFTTFNAPVFLLGNSEWFVQTQFVKNATLETLPEIPWSATSCGPDSSPVRNEL